MEWKKWLRQVPDLFGDNTTDVINPHELVREYSIEELSETAEEYFARVTDPWYHTDKPFASPEDAQGPANVASKTYKTPVALTTVSG